MGLAVKPACSARLYSFLSVEHRLFGSALLRISFGALALYYIAGHWGQRHLLWGADGMFPLWLFERELPLARTPSLFAVESPALLDLLLAATAAVSALYAVGWRTRWLQWPFALALWSLLARNPFLLTGGDNLVQVVLPFLPLLDTSAYLSFDSGWRGWGSIAPPPPRPYRALLHNFALGCILVQLCIMYGAAGLEKVAGHAWRHGTAVYYVLRTQEFGVSSLAPLIYRCPAAVTLITYGVVAFEVAFPALIWSRRTRWVACAGAVALHGGIAIVLGLVPFAIQALIFQFVLFDDDQYAGTPRRRASIAAAALLLLLSACTRTSDADPIAAQLESIQHSGGGRMGVAGLDLQSGRRLSFRGRECFPLASVAKLPLAVAVLDRVDRGDERLTRTIAIEAGDVVPGGAVPGESALQAGETAPLEILLERMLVDSDNTAATALRREAAAGAVIEAKLRSLGIGGIHVERSPAGTLAEVRAALRLPPDERRATLDRLERDPNHCGEPDAIVELLAMIGRGAALSPPSTARLLDLMHRCATGDARLAAGLPRDARLAHKTGTLPRTTNDVGLVTASDGRQFAIAVFITASRRRLAARETAVASAGRAVFDALAGNPTAASAAAPER